MKCSNCIFYDSKYKLCEKNDDKDNCKSYRNIANCMYNCDECPQKYDCDMAKSEQEEIDGYIKDLTRNSEA